MAYRCEYCGQLYEGLSCPHCCAPRGDDDPSVDIFYADNVPYWRSDVGFIDRDGNPVDISSTSDDPFVGVKQMFYGNPINGWPKWSRQMDMKRDPEYNPEANPETVDYFLPDIDLYEDENSDVVDKTWVQYGEGTSPVLLGGDDSIDKDKERCDRIGFALGVILMLFAVIYIILC